MNGWFGTGGASSSPKCRSGKVCPEPRPAFAVGDLLIVAPYCAQRAVLGYPRGGAPPVLQSQSGVRMRAARTRTHAHGGRRHARPALRGSPCSRGPPPRGRPRTRDARDCGPPVPSSNPPHQSVHGATRSAARAPGAPRGMLTPLKGMALGPSLTGIGMLSELGQKPP